MHTSRYTWYMDSGRPRREIMVEDLVCIRLFLLLSLLLGHPSGVPTLLFYLGAECGMILFSTFIESADSTREHDDDETLASLA